MARRIGTTVVLALLIFLLAEKAAAFLPPRDTAGPVTVAIEAPDKVTELGKPFDVTVRVENTAAQEVEITLEVWVIDDWNIGDVQTKKVEPKIKVPAGERGVVKLAVTAGAKSYNALYPIHARATFTDPATKETRTAHPIKIVEVAASRTSPTRPTEIKAGLTPLIRLRPQSVALQIGDKGEPRELGAGWRGSDKESGATFDFASIDRGGRQEAISIHPPYRKGWGNIWADYEVTLPDMKPITLTFATAIRDNAANEPPSDGVEFKVFVGEKKSTGEPPAIQARKNTGEPPAVQPGENSGGAASGPKALFARFTKSKTWEPASVDLSEFAGKTIALRLWAGPGPAHNTVCDSGHWGNPAIVVGKLPPAPSADSRAALQKRAIQVARQALRGGNLQWGWQIQSESGTFGVCFLPGAQGLCDAAVAIASEKQNLVFAGYQIQIDGTDIAAIPLASGATWQSLFDAGRGAVETTLLCGEKPTKVRVEVWAENGALRCKFSMPGVERNHRGHPRFTLIGLGPAVETKPERVYAGFGNVLEKPGRFTLSSDGFHLSTRHVGVDYDNGLSVVQATDIFPDRLVCDPEQSLCSMQVHHDATVSLIPSEKGAFAAAKVYREGIANFKPAPSLNKLQGRMCLDYWGTDYKHGITTVEQLAKYGVTDCVYVWHNWQRWGYDYRLPEIYPARGDHGEFLRLAETCRKHGILFCPHDNYIDFYPDAEGYSYAHIIFNEDGTPQKAWFNKGRAAQSYRWRPDSFQPWMKKNIALLAGDVKPDAYFIDVFTAIAPMDFYDHTGKFHTKMETIQKWCECFDYVRAQFGGAPQISEAGSDHHIGHLDAGESDHNSVTRDPQSQWGWKTPCADAERTPWHDMASHGSFILFAGGLASRYVSGLDQRTHGYGSDDYLSLTVLGGRNPMAHGDSSAETILTYWMLHDICAELGKRPMTSHEFADGDIHRQIVRFGNDATVWVNRGTTDWKVGEDILPPYGFIARAGNVRAQVTRREGVVCGYAESAGAIFVDARPPRRSLIEANTERKVIGFGPVATNGAFRLSVEKDTWEIVLLPGSPVSEIRIKPSQLAGKANTQVAKIERLDESRKAIGAVEYKQSGDEIIIQTTPDDFGYRLMWHLIKP
ncbi:MAG: hypothetical protein N3D11_05915 [Candidatus Sumerlaeia bacterium]|nr:hypothetical protein [Candidatus Sumerlaeia bacterium]